MQSKRTSVVLGRFIDNGTKYLHIEFRAVSGVFRTIDPPPPLHPASGSSLRTKGGGTHSPGGEGVGVNISEHARQWKGLLQYNPSTLAIMKKNILKIMR